MEANEVLGLDSLKVWLGENLSGSCGFSAQSVIDRIKQLIHEQLPDVPAMTVGVELRHDNVTKMTVETGKKTDTKRAEVYLLTVDARATIVTTGANSCNIRMVLILDDAGKVVSVQRMAFMFGNLVGRMRNLWQ